MKKMLIAHFCIPALLTVGVFVFALGREPFGLEMFVAIVIEGYLFYAAPHLLWAIIAAIAKPSNRMWHAGFIAPSAVLLAISAFWLYPGDRSGLPMQWLLYWPLAILLQFVALALTAAQGRTNTPDSSSLGTCRDRAALRP